MMGLMQKRVNTPMIMDEILYLTGGQPFLTQKLCQLVLNHSENSSVTDIAQQYIINNWEFQDEPEHLRTIRSRILLNSQQSNSVLDLYRQILQGYVIKFDNSSEHQSLCLSGLIVNKNGQLQVYNSIYAKVFNLDWIEQQLAQLRPYNQQIRGWLASKQQASAYLLRGEILQDALTWSLGKNLSQEDYQFLSVSQQLAKREVEQNR